MEKINEKVYCLAKKINRNYDLFTEGQIESIKTADHNQVIKFTIILLDFILKQKKYDKYKSFLDQIASTITVNNHSYHSIELMVDWLKKHHIIYRINGGTAIDICKTPRVFSHDTMIVDIYEKNIEYFTGELYGIGGFTEMCYDNGYIKPAIISKFGDCDSVTYYEDGSKIGVRLIAKSDEKKLCYKIHETTPTGNVTYEKAISDEEHDLCFTKSTDGISIQSLESVYLDKLYTYDDRTLLDLLSIAPYVNYDIIEKIRLLPKNDLVVKEKSDNNGLSKIS